MIYVTFMCVSVYTSIYESIHTTIYPHTLNLYHITLFSKKNISVFQLFYFLSRKISYFLIHLFIFSFHTFPSVSSPIPHSIVTQNAQFTDYQPLRQFAQRNCLLRFAHFSIIYTSFPRHIFSREVNHRRVFHSSKAKKKKKKYGVLNSEMEVKKNGCRGSYMNVKKYFSICVQVCVCMQKLF